VAVLRSSGRFFFFCVRGKVHRGQFFSLGGRNSPFSLWSTSEPGSRVFFFHVREGERPASKTSFFPLLCRCVPFSTFLLVRRQRRLVVKRAVSFFSPFSLLRLDGGTISFSNRSSGLLVFSTASPFLPLLPVQTFFFRANRDTVSGVCFSFDADGPTFFPSSLNSGRGVS